MSSDRHLQPHLFHEVRTDDPKGPYQYVKPEGLNYERDPEGYANVRAMGFDIADTETPGVHALRTTERYVDPESRSMRHMAQTPKPGSPEATWHANRLLNTRALSTEMGATASTDNTRGMERVPFDPADVAYREEEQDGQKLAVFHDRRDPERVLGKASYSEKWDGNTEVGNAYLDPALRGQGLSQVAAKSWLAGRGEVSTPAFSAAGQAAFARHGVRSRGGLSGHGRR